MFGNLIVWYLFLGGGAAGMVVVLSALDLAYGLARGRRGASPRPGSLPGSGASPRWAAGLRPTLFARGFAASTLVLALGLLCLLGDLGRPDRFFYVFLHPTASVLTFGSFVLGLTLAVSAFLAIVCVFAIRKVPVWVLRVAEALGVALGLATAVYTGVLLAQMDAVPLWNPMVPVLFTLSALSVGVAGVLACMQPLDELPAGRGLGGLVGMLGRADVVLVILEALALGTFVLWAELGGHASQVVRFACGPDAGLLWLGFFGMGIVAPLVLEGLAARMRSSALVTAAIPCVIVGGFFLRWCLVNVPVG